MTPDTSRARRRAPRSLTRLLCVGGIIGASAGGIVVVAVPAAAASPDVVISEVYGGGGNSGSTFKNDFIELYNTSGDDVTVPAGGWAVQYFSASGNSGGTTDIPAGTVLRAGRYFLIQEAAGTGGTVSLPAPDLTGTLNLSGTNGEVALLTDQTALANQPSATGPTVRDFLGYGSAGAHEGTAAAPTLSNTTADSRNQNLDTDPNGADFAAGTPSPTNSAGTTGNAPVADNGCTAAGSTTIEQIEGSKITSPLAGSTVTCVSGIVTATESNSFFLQQTASLDSDPNTSEGLYVHGVTPPPVGDSVLVSGTVSNYAAGYSDSYQLNIQTPELGSASYSVTATGQALPAPVVIGGQPGDQLPPKENVSSVNGDVQTGAFNRSTDALDFWRSLYGMRVQIRDARVTGPNNTGGHGPVVVPGGVDSGLATPSGGVLYDSYADPNTRAIQVYDNTDSGVVPAASVGDTATAEQPVVGVIDFFGNPELQVTQAPAFTSGGLRAQTTPLTAAADQLSVATYNVENLNPQNAASKYQALATQIVSNLKAPNLIAVEEVQDNSGATDDGTVSASTTLSMLTSAISAAGGPSYLSTGIDPANDADGGQPGGNIRQVFLYNPAAVTLVSRPGGGTTVADSVVTDPTGTHLAQSPGRIDPTNPAWKSSRKPLAAEFTLKTTGAQFFAIGNHFDAKLGDAPLYARNQPPARSSETQRMQQATIVNNFVSQLEQGNPNANIVVLGDFNDYTFSQSLATLRGSQLRDLFTKLPANQQYDYVFQGQSQTLDHILVSGPLFGSASFSPVHVNAEFTNQTSDHDPEVAILTPAEASSTPPPSLPESPVALLVPLAGLAALGGAFTLRRRRRTGQH